MATSSSTTQNLIDEVKRWLLTGQREMLNRLADPINTATDQQLVMEFALEAIQAGAKISIDLEDMHVRSVSSPNVSVYRGRYGSTAATHPDASIVFVNPKFSQFEIFTEMNNELASLSSPANGLFQVRTVDLTYAAGRDAYNLTSVSNLESVLAVSYESIGADQRYVPIDHWRIQRELPVADFASGYALTISSSVDPGATIRVAYADGFSSLSTVSDVVVIQTGLPATCLDILVMGTAIRLSASREIARNFYEEQGDTRRAAEVPPGANLNAPRGLMAKYQERIAEEAARLQRRWPMRVTV